ncbi:uncharacterized protein LOC144163775 [Haemaphysalis longicornis]
MNVRHPVVLPNRGDFTRLVIAATHERLIHSSVDLTLCELRENFWILKGRQVVKSVLHACLPCRRRRLKAETAPVAPLPRDRITEADPFSVVGIGFCGPLYCQSSHPEYGKAYIVVFSCAVTRAIHLELSSGMTASRFLLALRRFISRRGVPTTINSDNALTFHLCARSLHTMSEAAVLDFCSGRRIQWKFSVERAPWWGGWWERFIRITKETLRRALGRSRLSPEEIETVLCEVEAAVNSRPLTPLAADAEELSPLTPAHFLNGRRTTSLPQRLGLNEPTSASGEIQRRARHRRAIMAHLWRRWRRECLLLLRSAHEAAAPPGPEVQIGDVVVIQDDASSPMLWKLGRVL